MGTQFSGPNVLSTFLPVEDTSLCGHFCSFIFFFLINVLLLRGCITEEESIIWASDLNSKGNWISEHIEYLPYEIKSV